MAVADSTSGASADRMPPVTALGMLSIALVASGVIYLAAYLPRRAPLGPAVALLAVAAAVLVVNVVSSLARMSSRGGGSSRSPAGDCSHTS